MNYRNFIYGISITAILVVGLGATRLMKMVAVKEVIEYEEISPVTLAPPPEPMIIEEVAEVVQTMTPPPPAFADLRTNLSIDSLALPSADRPISPDMEVDLFSQDLSPPPLPTIIQKRVKTKTTINRPAPIAKANSSIGISDLDARPRVLRLGSFRWPSSVRTDLVKATVLVEIDQNGKVRLLKIHSVSDPAFKTMLARVVHGCRFSAPKYKGQSVKVPYTWNLILKKP